MFILPGQDYPKLDRNVQFELHRLGMCPRDVKALYRTFCSVRAHDPLTANLGSEEVTTDSCLRLIRYRREWVAKILKNILELGGFVDATSWNGFLFVLLKFCTLSKLELAQVMFYVIAREMKSWTVHYVTTAQLEEFYEMYEDCPFKSFNTGSITFNSLSMAKFPMVEFIELTYKHAELVAPILHLQRSIQQSLPNMKYWRSYDKVRKMNQKIKLDFFRLQKVSSIMEVIKDKRRAQEDLLNAGNAPSKQDMDSLQNWVDPKVDPLDPRTQVRRFPQVDASLPLPLPGPDGVPGRKGPPGWIPGRREKPPPALPLPAWIEEMQLENIDPKTGAALGEAAVPKPIPNWAQPLEASLTVAHAKDTILNTHKPIGYDARLMELNRIEQDKADRVTASGTMDAMIRNQELDFIRKSRGMEAKRSNILSVMESCTQCELITRRSSKPLLAIEQVKLNA